MTVEMFVFGLVVLAFGLFLLLEISMFGWGMILAALIGLLIGLRLLQEERQ